MNANPADKVADNRLVFPHVCHVQTINEAWEQIQKRAGEQEPFRFHDLRVSFCTNLVAAGIEAATLKKLARHTSLAATLKYYRDRTDEADGQAMGKVEPIFSTVVNPALSEPATREQNGEKVLRS